MGPCAWHAAKLWDRRATGRVARRRLRPTFVKARFARGRALYFLGEYAAAFEQYETGLKMGSHPRIERWLAAERAKPEYAAAARVGPHAQMRRVVEAIRGGDLKRLALLLQHCPPQALESGVGSSQPSPLHVAAALGQVSARHATVCNGM